MCGVVILYVVVLVVTVCWAMFVVKLRLYGPRVAHVSVLVLVVMWCRRSRCSCLRSRLRVRRLILRSTRFSNDLHFSLVWCGALSPRSIPKGEPVGGGCPALPRGGGVARTLGCSLILLCVGAVVVRILVVVVVRELLPVPL